MPSEVAGGRDPGQGRRGDPHHLHPHRPGQASPEDLHLVAELHEQRPVEGLLVDHGERRPGGDPALGEEPEHVRVGIGDRRERPPRARGQLAERLGRLLVDRQVAGRNRVAVGVAGRVAELRRDQLLELLGEHVLEHLGLGMDPIPRDAETLHEVELEQPVMAHHLERHAPAVIGERHAPIRLMLDQSELPQPLDHPRRRRRRHAEPGGDGVRRHGLAPAALERIDRLGVVLDWSGDGGLVACHDRNYGMPKL